MRPQIAKTLPALTVVAALCATLAFLARPRVVTGDPTGVVPFAFPEELGGYKSVPILFCSNDQCARSFRMDELPAADAPCPVCTNALGPISIGERVNLPPFTPIFRTLYVKPGHPDIQASIVFSGIERRSIHRPQVCLVSQGARIVDEYDFPVPAPNGDESSFQVRLLEAVQIYKDPVTGKDAEANPFVYAYWLFNPERETTSHLARFLRMMVDNGIRGYRPRWGYAAVTFPRDARAPDAWRTELASFLPLLHPLVTDIRAKLDANRDVRTILTGASSTVNAYEGEGPVNR